MGIFKRKVISPIPEENIGTWITPNKYKVNFVTPTPTPAPVVQTQERTFDVEPFRKSGNYQIPKMPASLATKIWDMFPNEATQAAIVLGTENASYDPKAYNWNPKDNSGDYGLAQINSRTLADRMKYEPQNVEATGVSNVYDLHDPEKNLKMMKLIRKSQGWNAWYGPKNRGFEL